MARSIVNYLLLSGAFALIIVMTLSPPHAEAYTQLFYDDFETGNLTNWRVRAAGAHPPDNAWLSTAWGNASSAHSMFLNKSTTSAVWLWTPLTNVMEAYVAWKPDGDSIISFDMDQANGTLKNGFRAWIDTNYLGGGIASIQLVTYVNGVISPFNTTFIIDDLSNNLQNIHIVTTNNTSGYKVQLYINNTLRIQRTNTSITTWTTQFTIGSFYIPAHNVGWVDDVRLLGDVVTYNLNLKILSADSSTLCTTVTTRCFTTLVNTMGTTKKQVTSGWANYTSLIANTYANVTLQVLNTTASNSYVKVNSSNSLTINMTATFNRVIISSLYQSVTWSFKKADNTAFTPNFFEIIFGNNSTQKNVTSTSVFVNGSNTINRIFWQNSNVKNTTMGFTITSNAQILVFKEQIYTITPRFTDTASVALTSGMQYNITIAAGANTTKLNINSATSFYMQNGSITTTVWWRGIMVNATSNYTVVSTATMTIEVQVGNDMGGPKTRFAQGISAKGVMSMLIEGVEATYKISPTSVLVNATTYTSADVANWNYTSSIYILNLTVTGMKSYTTIHTISLNAIARQIRFNATGSETLYIISYSGVACAGVLKTVELKEETSLSPFPTPTSFGVNVTAFYPTYYVAVGINATSFTVCDEPFLVATVTNLAGSQYYRTLLLSSPLLTQNMYLVDTYKYLVHLYTLKIVDPSSIYRAGEVQVTLSGNVVASGIIDNNGVFGVYLVPGRLYGINLIASTGETFTQVNGVDADPANLIITVTVTNIPMNSQYNVKSQRIAWSALWSGANIQVTYLDLDSSTSSLTVRIYEQNSTRFFNLMFDTTYLTTSSLTVSYAANTSRAYYVRLSVVHGEFGTYQESKVVTTNNLGVTWPTMPNTVMGLNYMFPFTGAWMYMFSAFVIIMMGFTFGAVFSGRGAIIVGLVGVFMVATGALPGLITYAIGALVIAVLAHISKERYSTN